MIRIPPKLRSRLRRINSKIWLWQLVGFLFIKLLNAWMSTLSYRYWRYDPTADPADESFSGPAIYIFWHEYIPLPIYLRPNCRLTMLLSPHQDAEVLTHVARHAGLDVVRGSSSRGGTAALRELIAKGKGMSLALTPDGPRGPRRQLAQGCIYLSSRLQIPIVPIGFGYDRPWRSRRTWDQFAIPKPFSRARAVVGPRIQVPAELDRNQLEEHRAWVEQQLELVTNLAEQWAQQQYTLPNSEPLYRASPGQVARRQHDQSETAESEAADTAISDTVDSSENIAARGST